MAFKKQHYYLLSSLLVTGQVIASPNHANFSTTSVDSKYPHLHVASPDWREQIIYQVMPDRFYDGDPSNNNQGAHEYDPSDPRKYSGGDLQGVMDKLSYIKGLGATAIWITPPVANLWWNPTDNYGGYHGYWARHFKQVDEHLGTLATYKALSNALHQQGMYLIQDVVVNHTGNFFGYKGEYDSAEPTKHFKIWSDNLPTLAPTQAPFDQNDVTNPKHRAANIYHWCPIIKDFNDPVQMKNCGLANLDDLNTENPVVREALRDAYGYWIRTVGVDGFRLDVARHVPHDFWHNFFYSKDAKVPGINEVAKQTGRWEFLSFGEAYESSKPSDDVGERIIFSHLGTQDKPEIKAMLNFPLFYSIKRVFAEGRSTAHLGYRLRKHLAFGNPYITPIFIDNHDQPRFASKGSRAALKQALTFLMTIPGIPVIWQGTEQALTETRASMFANGYGSGGVDHFETQSEIYQFIKQLAHIRQSHPVFTRGSLKVLAEKTITRGVGVFAYQRQYQDTTAIVVFNTSEQATLMSHLTTGLAAGSQLKLLMGEGIQRDFVVNQNGHFSTELPARAMMILIHDGDISPIETTRAQITMTSPIEGKTLTEDMKLTGTVTAGITELKLIMDGFREQAIDFHADTEGNWNVILPVSKFGAGEEIHTVSIYAPKAGIVSKELTFKSNVIPDNRIEISIDDPLGDDKGPNGTYQHPKDETFKTQMDIQKVKVLAENTTLNLVFTLSEVTDSWNPPNEFDHLSLNIYFDLPNREGLKVLPKINAHAPDGFHWDYSSIVYGGGNSFHTNEQADADNMGKPVNGAAKIQVDKDKNTIQLTYDAFYLGLETWEGVKIYATTWDIDGIENIYRPLKPEAGQWHFSGRKNAYDPLIADDIEVIALPD
jgi:glycosidase